MAVATRLLLVAAACIAVARAIVFETVPFREHAVCEAQGRPLGACMEAERCTGAVGILGGSCGLPGADSSGWRCCQPSAQPPAVPREHGARSRRACGKYREASQKQSCDNFQPLTDGREVRQGDFPHFAGVGFVHKSKRQVIWSCGGSLISENFVLTSAVCAQGSPSTGTPMKVRLGAVDFSNKGTDSAGDGVQELDVAETFVHPEFSKTSFYNDIALLRLFERARLSRAVQPACLYPEEHVPVQRAIVAGFGTDGTQGQFGTLSKVDIPLVSDQKCNEIYKNFSHLLNQGINSENQFCAGEKGRDTCAGDSGAPLVIKEGLPVCAYQIIGLSSLGRTPCGSLPGIYTKLYSYLPWIENIIWG